MDDFFAKERKRADTKEAIASLLVITAFVAFVAPFVTVFAHIDTQVSGGEIPLWFTDELLGKFVAACWGYVVLVLLAVKFIPYFDPDR